MNNSNKYICQVCGYVYDELQGIPNLQIQPNIKFKDLPDDFECPICGVGKERFVLK